MDMHINNNNICASDIKLNNEKGVCGKIAIVMMLVVLLAFSLQIVLSYVFIDEAASDKMLGAILISFFSMYIIALPAGALLLRIPAQERNISDQLSAKKMIGFFFMMEGLAYIGNIMGTVLAMLFTGGNAQNSVMTLATGEGHILLKTVCLVLLAPLLEEFVFRKLIIDSTLKFSEKGTVIFSALVFSLYHVNLFQLFYTFGIGLLWGYIYLRTGKIRYSYVLHVILNFQGIIVSGLVLKFSQIETLLITNDSAEIETLIIQNPEIIVGIIIYALYAMLMLAFSITGVILLIRNRKKWYFTDLKSINNADGANKKMVLNVGMGIYGIVSLILMVAGLMI